MKRLLPLLLLPMVTACAIASPFAPDAASQGARAYGADRDGVAIVKGYYASLVKRDPQLVAKKYELMSDSAFAFFRGSAHLFYADVAKDKGLASSLKIPLMGDLHLENLGTYQTSEGSLAYDLNDFDESFVGPYTWEVARCATSILLAADEAGLKAGEGRDLVETFLVAYRDAVKGLAKNPQTLSRPLGAENLHGPAVEAIASASKASRADFIAKQTERGSFKLGKKLSACDEGTRERLRAAVAAYAAGRSEGARFYRVKDVAARLAGVASIGRYRYVALIEGASESPDDDVILEFKEEATSAAAPYAASPVADEAARVAQAYRYFLPGADRFLGTARVQGLDYLIRELQPAKGGVELADLKGSKGFASHMPAVALAAARAHARSGRVSDLIADMGDEKAFVARIRDFAVAYHDQVQEDHRAFKKQR
ncbi:DUF2252 family protein [bacterium]|nr:DUF2252 family protein [bacterium]